MTRPCYSINVGYIADGRTPVPGNSLAGGDRTIELFLTTDSGVETVDFRFL